MEDLGRIVVATPKGVPLYLSDLASIEDGFARTPMALTKQGRALFLRIRPSPEVGDADLSALVSKVATAATPPGSVALVSGPIQVSHCQVGVPEVSGEVVVLDTNVELDRGGALLARGEGTTFLLAGESLVAAVPQARPATQLIAFPQDGKAAVDLAGAWQGKLVKTPGVATSVLAPAATTLLVQLEHRERSVLDRAAKELQEALATGPAMSSSVIPSGEEPGMDMQVDREALARYGVTAADVARTMRTAMHGEIVARFQDGRDEGAIVLRIGEEQRSGDTTSAEELLAMQLTTPAGIQVPLAQLVRIERTASPRSIYHYGGRRQIMVRITFDSPGAKTEVMGTLESTLLPRLRSGEPQVKATIRQGP